MFNKSTRQVCGVFLDRDGVLNYDRGDYSWLPEHFRIIDDSMNAIKLLDKAGLPVVVITNQAGIAKGLYTSREMDQCHALLQKSCGNAIRDFYYSPYHPTRTESLSRKPESLLFERAIAKYGIEPSISWMVGDKERDLIPARKVGMKTIMMGSESSDYADYKVEHLTDAVQIILSSRESEA